MKVTILMSTYNGEKYLTEQIESILKQKTIHQIELLVRDDGSTDKTKEILEKYHKEGKLKWFSGENVGPQNSFYDLMLKSPDSDFYAFSDQDDYWYETKIQNGLELLKNKSNIPCLYYSNAKLVDSRRNYMNRNVYKREPASDLYTLAVSGGLLGCTMIFNSNLMDNIKKNKFIPKMFMHDFYVALLCKSLDGEIIYDKECSMDYRQHDNNVVGVNTGRYNMLNSFFREITMSNKVGISEQAQSIVENYKLDYHKKRWLLKISKYKRSLFNRLCLAVSVKTKYCGLKCSLKRRLSVLLGKR